MITDARPGDASPDTEELRYFRVPDEAVEVKVTLGPDESPAPAGLATRLVRLVDGLELRQLRVADTRQKDDYERLDNEILAGLWLWQAAEAAGRDGYPLEVSRLHGYEATSAESYALLEPYEGDPLTEAGQYLLEDEQHRFQVSLLTGLCWLAAAGIAHRGISPSTVRWDGRRAQITDFSASTVIGAPRQVIGALPWAAREQRQGHAEGRVSARDDIWAAGRLIFYSQTGEELAERGQLDDRPVLKNLLAGVFGPPEERPTARALLERMGEECPVPRAFNIHARTKEGRQRFYAERSRKHPGGPRPPEDDEEDPGPPGQPQNQSQGWPGPPPGLSASPDGHSPPPAWAPQQPESRRRLWRFSPQASLIAGGLAVLGAARMTALTR